MTTVQHLAVAPASHEDRAIASLTAAFAGDPVVRWVFPEAHQYVTYWPPFVAAFAGAAFAKGTADSIDNCAGVALWLAPGVSSDDEAMGAILEETVAERDRDDVFALLGQMSQFHPAEPHWYLPLIGVDLPKVGRGYGSILLRHAFKRADEDGLPAYLEATSPSNRSLYMRNGFEDMGVIQVGDSPPMWPMLRQPH
jgi:GNAT superfamily N-acetyltransferase